MLILGDVELRRKLKLFYEEEGQRSTPREAYLSPLMSPLIEIALQLSNVKKMDIVLDVGCGNGDLLRRIEDAVYAVGIELSSVRARRAKKNGLEIIISDAEHLPFKDGVFTICFAIEVLEHIPEPKNVVAELDRVSSSSACAIIVTPNDRNWFLYRVLAGNFSEAFHSYGHLHDFSQLEKIQEIINNFRVAEVKENRKKVIILMEGMYRSLVSLVRCIPRRSTVKATVGSTRIEHSIVEKFLTLYERFMPMPKLTLHIIVRLVKDRE